MKALALIALAILPAQCTASNVPGYPGHPKCTSSNAQVIRKEFAKDGANAETQNWFVYVASRESGCNYKAVYINSRTGDNLHCAFMLNARSGPLSRLGLLTLQGFTPYSVKTSMAACANAASNLWKRCGKHLWIRGDYGCRRP